MIRFFIILVLIFVLPARQNAFAREVILGPVEARVVKVRDGDSIEVEAHIWPGQFVRVSVRIRSINAPELRGRVLAHVETSAGIDVGKALRAHGLARKYNGGRRKSWCGMETDQRVTGSIRKN